MVEGIGGLQNKLISVPMSTRLCLSEFWLPLRVTVACLRNVCIFNSTPPLHIASTVFRSPLKQLCDGLLTHGEGSRRKSTADRKTPRSTSTISFSPADGDLRPIPATTSPPSHTSLTFLSFFVMRDTGGIERAERQGGRSRSIGGRVSDRSSRPQQQL